jgi:hypothetical protein
VTYGEGWTGGTGFRVTFRPDGTQVVDYSSMLPFSHVERDVTMTFGGRAAGRITTDANVAKVVTIEPGTVTMDVDDPGYDLHWDLTGTWGPAGLGSTSDNNRYTCTETTVTYQGSLQAGLANVSIRLMRRGA